jgi:hypothetical protein
LACLHIDVKDDGSAPAEERKRQAHVFEINSCRCGEGVAVATYLRKHESVNSCLFGGRTVNRWFRQCSAEHQALRDAVRRGNTNATCEAKCAFYAKKRRVQHQLMKQTQSSFLDDVKHNPRRFGSGSNVALPAALPSRSFMIWMRSLSTGSLFMRLMAAVV